MILDTALGGTQEPDEDYGRADGSSSDGGDVRHDETGSARILELEDQVRELNKQLAQESRLREVEQEKHVRHEEALREELGVERPRRIDADRKNERLKERTNKLRNALALLHGESSAAEAMHQQVSQLEAEVRRLEAERLRRMRVERRLAGSLAALVGLLIGIVPWASGLTGGTLPVAVDACGGAFLLVGAAVLIWGSGALVVCCALIGVGTSIVSTVISAYSATAQKTQTTTVSQTGSGHPAGGKTPKSHQQSPRGSKRHNRQTRSKH